MQINLAPIVLFVNNRPWHTNQCLESLSRNNLAGESVLYIYADGPKENITEEQLQKIREVRKIIREKQWCKEVHFIESEKNNGLADSIIAGVTDVVNKYGKVIVLEDDLITSVGFLEYMNEALKLYTDDEKVMQISGYNFPVENHMFKHESFFIHMTTSWGWGTWKRAWNKFDPHATGYEILKTDNLMKERFDIDNSYPYSTMLVMQMESTEINSWAIRWWWSVFKAQGISLFPDKSLVKNIGFDSEGTHTKRVNPFSTENFDENYLINTFPTGIQPDEELFKEVKKCLRKTTSQEQNFYQSMVIAAKKIISEIKFFF